MSSITGLDEGNFTAVNNQGEIRLGSQLDSGTSGEVIISNGRNNPVSWGSNSSTTPNALTAGTNITYSSGNVSWDGGIGDTINATSVTYTAGAGIGLVGTTFSTDNDGTTINNVGGTGAQNQVLKVPNVLTAGTNITYSSGTTYDGSTAITINATDTDTTYTAGNGIDLTGTTFSTDNDGTTINNTGGTGAQNQVLKVPNALTAGTGIQLVGGSGPVASYSGDDATTINCTITDTTYQGGDNITIDTTTNPDTIDLDKTIVDQTSIQFNNSGTTTSIVGSTYYMNPRTDCTYLDLSSSTNLILPDNVFETSPGVYKLAFNQGIWKPNDDSSYYNYSIEDDFTYSLVAGRGKVMTSSLELEGFINVPNGWRATKIFIDVRNSSGNQVSQTITMYEVKTWSTANPVSGATTYLGASTTNTEYTLSSTMDGAIDNSLWVEVSITSTSYYIAGGYLVLTKI
jgi:hypothetical protein